MKCIIAIIVIVFLMGLTAYCVYKLTTCENYTKMKDLGKFPINIPNTLLLKGDADIDITENKYDAGHRYRHRRRYNFLGSKYRTI